MLGNRQRIGTRADMRASVAGFAASSCLSGSRAVQLLARFGAEHRAFDAAGTLTQARTQSLPSTASKFC
jgi:hypothetical protein